MSYLVIDADGTLHHREARPTAETIRSEVGDWDMVRCHRDTSIRGWVGDTGLIDGSPRNIVGSLMLITSGAAVQPYAGRVVITGWHQHTEIEPLAPLRVTSLRMMHSCIEDALAGKTDCPSCYRAAVEIAEMVRSAPTPQVQVVSLDDWASR